MDFGFELIVIAAMLGLNAVLAAYEIALASITTARVHALAQQRRHGAEAARFMKDRMEGSLAVVQLGITLAGAIAAAFGGAGMEEVFSPWLQSRYGMGEGWAEALAIACLIIPLSALSIIFAELVPKMIAINDPERILLRLSPGMRLCSIVIAPVIRVFEFVVRITIRLLRLRRPESIPASEHAGLLELRAAATLARSTRVIGPLQERIVHAAAQLSTRTLNDVMIPAADLATIPVEAPILDALILAHRFMHTRFPVVNSSALPPDVIGYINFKDIVTALKVNPENPTVRGILRPIDRLDRETTLAAALEHLTRRKEHIAVVTNSSHAVIGLVTLEDVIEDLIGDIEDEFDRLPNHTMVSEAGIIAGGGTPMPSLLALLSLPKPATSGPGPVVTLAEWCEARVPAPLQGGEFLRLEGLVIHVRKVRRHRLLEAIVSTIPAQPTQST